MTRILVITNLYPPHAYGGYESLCRAAVEHWRSTGDEVTVLTSETLRTERLGDPDDPHVRRELPLYWADHRILHPPVRERLRNERRSRARVLATMDDTDPDVVSIWNLAGLSVGLLRYIEGRGVPIVAVVGDRWPTFAPDIDAWARIFDRRGMIGRTVGRAVTSISGLSTTTPADTPLSLVCASRHLADDALTSGRFRRSDLEVVAHGVDLDSFPLTVRDASQPWGGRLLVVSRIDPRKGLATTIRALAELPHMTLDVVGTGDEEHLAALEALSVELGVAARVRFHGEADRRVVRHRYLEADVAIVPSEWDEPFGIVPLEAMACGTPVVATGTGGSGEFLADGRNCLLFAPGDPSGLASCVRRLSDDIALRGQLSAAGASTAEGLSQSSTFEELARRHRRAARAPQRDGAHGTRPSTAARAPYDPSPHEPEHASE